MNYILYVGVRSDLPSMNPGKAEAHSGHAASQHAHFCFKGAESNDPILVEAYSAFKEWAGDRGFGTQINFTLPQIDEAQNLISMADDAGVLWGRVIDPTYPYIVDPEVKNLIRSDIHTADPVKMRDGNYLCHRKETTAFWFFLPEDHIFRETIKKYPLKK